MTETTFVIIGGFGLSGSSAASDLLREFNSVKIYDTELRFITDPDGILSLEDAIVNSWSPYRTDKAIKRFRILVDKLTDPLSTPYTVIDHTAKLNSSFKRISENYISRLISYTYSGSWFGITNPLITMFGYINKEIEKEMVDIYKDIFVSHKKDEFIDITKDYIKEIYKKSINDKNIKYILIDEGYSSLFPSRVMKFFDNCKMIIVDRDPRDNYLNAKNRRRFIPQDADTFIQWYKSHQEESLREGKNDNILRIHFEDLVLNYGKTKRNILEFLSLDRSEHISPKRYFDPSKSQRVVGLWENSRYKQDINYQQDIRKIYYNLREYCWRGPVGPRQPFKTSPSVKSVVNSIVKRWLKKDK